MWYYKDKPYEPSEEELKEWVGLLNQIGNPIMDPPIWLSNCYLRPVNRTSIVKYYTFVNQRERWDTSKQKNSSIDMYC